MDHIVATATKALPHWDMTVIYPSLESPEFEQSFRAVVDGIADLGALWDQLHIDKQDPAPLDAATVTALETIIERYNTLLDTVQTVGAYIASFVATNSRDTTAQARYSEFQQQMVPLSQLGTRFTAWLGALDVEGLIAQSAVARDHAFMLRKAHEQAAHLMSSAEEALAVELNIT